MKANFKRHEKIVVGFIKSSFSIFSSLIYLFLDVIKIFGAFAAIALLFKLYPSTWEIIANPLGLIFRFILYLIKVDLIILVAAVVVLVGLYLFKILEQMKHNRIQRRDEFLEDLAIKIRSKKR